MITYFQGRHRTKHMDWATAMFRLRAETFFERLKWAVDVQDGCEVDELDNADPLYVLAISEDSGTLCGSLRLLPTTGPTLLKTSLGKLFSEPVDIESPFIWECSRFAVATQNVREPVNGVCPITAELMMAVCNLALEAGISQIMGVFEKSMNRIYRRVGWVPDIIATSSTSISIGLWTVSYNALENMRSRCGIDIVTVEIEATKQLVAA